MVDLINAKLLNFQNSEWKNFHSFLPETKILKSKRGHHYLFWENLRFEFVPYLNELWIRNSLHKFYNAVVRPIKIGQENYNDFSYVNLCETIDFLGGIFDRKPEDFELFGKFEYGVNIDVAPYKPLDIINSYLSYATTRINPFYVDQPYEGKPIGKSCYLTDYRIKFYDKSKQANIPQQGIFRYEICVGGVGRLKKLFNKNRVTLLDLLDKCNLSKLTQSLMESYRKIKKLPFDQDTIPREIMLGLLAYSEPVMVKYDERRLTQWQFNQQRAEYKLLMDKYSNSPESIHTWVEYKLKDRLTQLTN